MILTDGERTFQMETCLETKLRGGKEQGEFWEWQAIQLDRKNGGS